MKRHGILLAFLAIASWANATIYYLKSSTDSPDAWADKEAANVVTDNIGTAFGKLSAANDELWIAKGSYILQTNQILSKQGVKIYGGFVGTESSLEERNADLLWTDNKSEVKVQDKITTSNNAVIFVNAIDVVMDGLCFNGENIQRTLESDVNSGGYAIVRFANNKTTFYLQNCCFENFYFHFKYTGTDTKVKTPQQLCCIVLHNSQAKVANCSFKGNKQTHECTSTGTIDGGNGGTAIYAGNGSSGAGATYRSTITNCVFDGNEMQALTCASLRANGYVTVAGCEFLNHTAENYKDQYALSVDNANTRVEECIFHNNAIRCFNLKNGGKIEKSLFYENTTYPAFFTNGTFLQNAIIMSSDVNIGAYASNATTNFIQENLLIGQQMGELKSATGLITWLHNHWLLSKAYPTVVGDGKVTLTSNTTITNDTPLTLSNYGPTVWPAEAWVALKTALGSVTPTFALEDGTPFYYTGADMSNPVSYTRSCYIDGYRESIILPFEPKALVDASGNDASSDFTFEWFKAQGESNTLTFVETSFDKLQANVPYLMRYTGLNKGDKADYTFKGEGLPARPASLGETFIGTYEEVPYSAGTTRYVLSVDGATEYFGKLASTARIAPYRAYLEIPADPSGAPARFSIAFGGSDEGGTTGIETAAPADRLWAADGAVCLETAVPQQVRVYGLDGSLVRSQWVDGSARIALPQGVYLVNNRKVVVR